MVKVNVISGFLGSGKTTLLKKIIPEISNNEKDVLIENEYGEVNIDSMFMKETGVEISEITSGCICCSMSGDFVGSLQNIIEWQSPDRIFIEPSGVAMLSDIIRNVDRVRKVCEEDEVVLGSVITVADAKRCQDYLENFGEFYINQINSSKCIILSHTQELKHEAINECLKMIRKYNQDAIVITTPWDNLSGSEIMEIAERAMMPTSMPDLIDNEQVEHHHHGHHHNCDDETNETFVTWGIETVTEYSKDELSCILEKMSNERDFGYVLRAKGEVRGTDGGWNCFDYIPGDFNIWNGKETEIGRVCVIGSALQEKKIEDLFGIK